MEKERNNLMELCNKAIEQARDILQQENKHIVIYKMVDLIYKRAEIIKEICTVEKYTLYFNGKAGLGKSTAICTLLDLIDTSKLKEGNNISSPMLLKTTAGRTTVCETVIIPVEKQNSKIVVEMVSRDDFQIILGEFCNWLTSRTCEIDEEEIRIIKNMAGIPAKLSLQEEIIDFINPEYVEGMKYDRNQFVGEQGCDILSQKINYDKRVKTVFEFNKEQCRFEEWLKNTFEKINDGKINDCAMPSRITIFIDKEQFSLNLPKFIGRVVDTRGLDGGERRDIQDLLKLNDSISLMCDEVPAFGGNKSVLSIMNQVMIQENRDTKYRVILIGFEKGAQLEDVSEFEGDREGGMKAKITQAKKKLQNEKIHFECNNFGFYNTLPGIKVLENKIHSHNKSEQVRMQKELFNLVEQSILNMYRVYTDEILEDLKKLNQLSSSVITVDLVNKISKCRGFVAAAKDESKNRVINILQDFDNQMMGIYHSSLRGAVNNKGIGKTADVYASFQKCGGEEFGQVCSELKSNFMSKMEVIFEKCDEMEAVCFECIMDEVDRNYAEIYEESRMEYHNRTHKNLYNDESWEVPRKYWGDRLGNYNRRVVNDVVKELREKKTEQELKQLGLSNKFFERVLEFMIIE